jgi:hypothetical protein
MREKVEVKLENCEKKTKKQKRMLKNVKKC